MPSRRSGAEQQGDRAESAASYVSVDSSRRIEPIDFEIFTDEAYMKLYHTITGGIASLMMMVSSIALVVGGIGVMNIMLVAVSERTHESGFARPWARRASILLQFLSEAMALSLAGGTLGSCSAMGSRRLSACGRNCPSTSPGAPWRRASASRWRWGSCAGCTRRSAPPACDPVASLRNE
jgi:hypothetical protein